MGYESRIYVVEKSTFASYSDGKVFADVIAMVDMCKYPELKDQLFTKKTDCYIYADDGNTHITKDWYDNELTEAPISDVIKFLEDEVLRGETYRRINPLLGLLKSFDMKQWNNLVCLHYGY